MLMLAAVARARSSSTASANESLLALIASERTECGTSQAQNAAPTSLATLVESKVRLRQAFHSSSSCVYTTP